MSVLRKAKYFKEVEKYYLQSSRKVYSVLIFNKNNTRIPSFLFNALV